MKFKSDMSVCKSSINVLRCMCVSVSSWRAGMNVCLWSLLLQAFLLLKNQPLPFPIQAALKVCFFLIVPQKNQEL